MNRSARSRSSILVATKLSKCLGRHSVQQIVPPRFFSERRLCFGERSMALSLFKR